jgi:hypothetical protein
MAVDALLTLYGELQLGGKTYRIGSQQPVRHSVTATQPRQSQVTIPGGTPGAVVLVWTALLDIPDTFTLLALETDKTVFVELVTDEGNDVGEESYTVELKPGLPLILGSQRSYANYTAGFGGGTLDLIETIRAQKLDATNAILTLTIA